MNLACLAIAFLAGAAIGAALCYLLLTRWHAKAAARREIEHREAARAAVIAAKYEAVAAARIAMESWFKDKPDDAGVRGIVVQDIDPRKKDYRAEYHAYVASCRSPDMAMSFELFEAGRRSYDESEFAAQHIDPHDIVNGLLRAKDGLP